MYLLPLVLPKSVFYARPGMFYYSLVMLVYYIIWMVSLTLASLEIDAGYCIAASNYILLDGVIKPAVIFYTLCIDSQVEELAY